jgi:hypothetical protein
MQALLKFLRAFPCKAFSSACFEHSIEAVVRGLAAKPSADVERSPKRAMPINLVIRMACSYSLSHQAANE